MSKKSTINRNIKRIATAKRFSSHRVTIKKACYDKNISIEERFKSYLDLWSLPRNSSTSRQRNRDAITGRPRGYYRYFNLDRISLRELANQGLIPGMRTSSW